MLRGSVSLSPDQMRLEMAKEQAILRNGKSFIPLMLINPNMNRIQGAIVLHASPYLDSITNLTKFHFEERGGPLLFNEGMDGGMHCNMLDCEHNRKFLASMYNSGYWSIQDKNIDLEIKELATGIKSRAVVDMEKKDPEKVLTDDELEAQAARLNAELANRKLAKSDMKTKKPVRQIIDATAEFAAQHEEQEQKVVEPVPLEVHDNQINYIPEPIQESDTVIETELPPETVIPKKTRVRRKSTLVNVE